MCPGWLHNKINGNCCSTIMRLALIVVVAFVAVVVVLFGEPQIDLSKPVDVNDPTCTLKEAQAPRLAGWPLQLAARFYKVDRTRTVCLDWFKSPSWDLCCKDSFSMTMACMMFLHDNDESRIKYNSHWIIFFSIVGAPIRLSSPGRSGVLPADPTLQGPDRTSGNRLHHHHSQE